MTLSLAIPDTVVQAIRLPEAQVEPELRKELAVALYAQGYLSFGKARELASLSYYEFGRLLGARGVARHYGAQELAEDLTYAGSE